MRNLGGETPRSLTGSLLVAHPNMLDPNFRRTVLFISAHDPNDGALGVIINRPLDKQVADLVSETPDRKSTRLNSSHDQISYAVFCLKKKTLSLRCSCVAAAQYRSSQLARAG